MQCTENKCTKIRHFNEAVPEPANGGGVFIVYSKGRHYRTGGVESIPDYNAVDENHVVPGNTPNNYLNMVNNTNTCKATKKKYTPEGNLKMYVHTALGSELNVDACAVPAPLPGGSLRTEAMPFDMMMPYDEDLIDFYKCE